MESDYREFDKGLDDEMCAVLSLLDQAYLTSQFHRRQHIADKIEDLMLEILTVEGCKCEGVAANISSRPLRSV